MSTTELSTKALFKQDGIQKRFHELLGKKAPGFISSVLQVVANNKVLAKANPQTVMTAAATAAALDLPINQNLGYAWIVPYKGQAQFQMGWKGYVQLAQRTGQYKAINVVEIYANQFKSFNVMTEELDADFAKPGEGEVVGYAAFFKLVNGFEKTCYWTKEAVIKHAKKYSQAYGSSHSPWNDKDQFDAMAKKTVLKNTLAKWGILSIEMQTAQYADQSTQQTEGDYSYPDNETVDIESEEAEEETVRALEFIGKATTIEDLELIQEGYPDMPEEVAAELQARKQAIESGK